MNNVNYTAHSCNIATTIYPQYLQQYGGTNKAQKQAHKERDEQASNKLLETMLTTACNKYSEEKAAKIAKTVVPFRVLGVLKVQPKVCKCAQEKEQEPDFKGIMASGQAIVFEAKHTEQEHIQWDAIKEHQRKYLNDYCRMNGLVFIIISFGFQKFYRIPWKIWRDMQTLYGRKYLLQQDISHFEIPMRHYQGKPAVLFLEGLQESY